MRSSLLPDQSSPPAARAPRALVIDGEARLSNTVREALEQGDCHVSLADEEGALEVLRVVEPDLILIDTTTRHSAFELCGEIRSSASGQNVPILLVSQDELDEQVVARGLLCGADDVIAAGRRPVELQARVRVQLRNKRDRDRMSRLRVERDTYQLEAKLDALTNIPNRRTFDARLAAACKSSDTFSLLFFDIDHFKRINDRMGHDAGDHVLAAVATCLRKGKRKNDFVARYGGEEFVALLPSTSREAALEQAEIHRAAIERLSVEPYIAAGGLSISIGAAVREGDVDGVRICRRADEALYAAKHRGRNRVVMAASASTIDVSSAEAFLLGNLATGRAGLPLLPEAAHEALRVAEDPHTDLRRIAKLVERDPSLAARFVALASSAAYSGRVRPTTTIAALVRIGLHTARDLLLQVVYERLHDELSMFQAEVADSFARSVRTAHAARQIARIVAPTYDLAYLCGLLHDIGEARIYRICSAYPHAEEAREEIEELVRKHHERAGGEVARAWHLPEDIVAACETHHEGTLTNARLPIKIVRGADALVRLAENVEHTLDPADDDVALLAQLGFEGPLLTLAVHTARRTFDSLANPDSSSDNA